MTKGETYTDGPKDQEFDDYALSLTPKTWHKQYVLRKEKKGRATTSIDDWVVASIQ